MTEERQRTVATDLARDVLHGSVPTDEASRRVGISQRSAYYLLQKFGYGSTVTPPEHSAPKFLRGDSNVTFDDVIMRRRTGESWDDLAVACGSEKTGKAFAKLIRYHCLRRGIEWPIAQVDRSEG